MADEYWGNDSDRVMHVVVLAVFCFLAASAIAFRLWARKIQRSRWELNDYLAIVGLIWALALSLFTVHSNVYWHLGDDKTQQGNPKAIMALVRLQVIAMIVGQVLWVVAVFFIRASILCLYTRIFRVKSFRITCCVFHGINVAFFTSVVLGALLICRPISHAWDFKAVGQCGNQKSFDMFIGVFNLLLDVCAVILPMPVLWRLQMSRSKKLVLSGIFGMGVVICVVTLARIWITSLIKGQNAQKKYSLIALLTCLEALLGVINTCLPVMKPVFIKFGTSKVWSSLGSQFSTIGRRSLFSRSSDNRSGNHRRGGHSGGWHRSHGSSGQNEMRSWPSSPTNRRDPLAPIFVDAKAANIMFAHKPSPGSPPRPPPKSPYYKPESTRWSNEDKAEPVGITVQTAWDIERGESENQGSVESDARVLKHEEGYEKMW